MSYLICKQYIIYLSNLQAVGTLLLPHQKQALAWMVSRENSNDLPPFWEERSNFYYNILTNFAEKQRPKTVLGGILADDMGLVIILNKFDFIFFFLMQNTCAYFLIDWSFSPFSSVENTMFFSVMQGKTLTTIALILTNFQDGKPLPVEKITSDKCYEVR